MISVVSFGPGSNFQFFKAIDAAWISNVLPPTARVLLTEPSGSTVASSFTFPVMFICFANGGNSGRTRWLTFRFVTVLVSWLLMAGGRIRKHASNASRLNRDPVLIAFTDKSPCKDPEVRHR